ncbi:MAG: hypothetical protein ACOYMA_13165 [Bacteroidia bacterium]
MFYKLLIVFLFVALGQSIFAQDVVLQKNGTTKTYQFSLPKKIEFEYKTDSGIVTINAKAIRYEFPYLTIKKKKDTATVDVRKITTLYYTSRVAGLYYVGGTAIALFCIPIVVISVKERIYEAALFFALPLALTYHFYREANKTFDTEQKWHFK